MKIFIPKDMVEDKAVDDYDIGVYCSLQVYTRNKDFNTYCVSWASISTIIYDTIDITVKIRTSITDALQHLIDYGILNVIEKKQQHLLVSKIEPDFTSQFITIDYSEFKKIMSSNVGHKMKMLRYYLKFISTLNWNQIILVNDESKKGIIGDCSLKHLSKLMNISENTVINVVQKLEKLKLIYVFRSDYYWYKGNDIQIPVNIYGRFKDKEYIFTYAKQVEEELKQKKRSNSQDGNNGRKLFQMYYWLIKGKKYSDDEIQLIYDHIKEHNDKMNEFYNNSDDEKYLKKIKDMSIFENFNFLIK